MDAASSAREVQSGTNVSQTVRGTTIAPRDIAVDLVAKTRRCRRACLFVGIAERGRTELRHEWVVQPL